MIKKAVKEILNELPSGISLVAAAKTRTPEEIMKAVEAGIEIVGENYVQEAEQARQIVGDRVKWHMIGHLQKNKVKKAVKIFDMIETVDSIKLCRAIDKACADINKIMPVLVEINSGEEDQKAGVIPDLAVSLIKEMCSFKNIKIKGLMTMGPFSGNPEDSRPYFIKTKKLFDSIKQENIIGVEMEYLSMGMSNSYKVALEEGANLIRIGTRIFGERKYS